MSILDKASLIQIPSGYKSGKLYSIKPDNGDGDFDFSRSSSATRVNAEGLIEEVSANVPRLDYSDESCPSLLLEGQSTNLVTYSEAISQLASKSNITITDNQVISPDGTLNAASFIDNSTSGFHRAFTIYSSSIASGQLVSHSIFAKAKEHKWFQLSTGGSTNDQWANFDLENGVVGNSSSSANPIMEYYGNGWYRCILFATTSANNAALAGLVTLINNLNATTRSPSYSGSNGGVYVFGLQIEQGSYPTSYIPSNSGSSTTRSADVCNNAGTSATFNDSEGVLFAEISALADENSNRYFSINDGSTNNRIRFGYTTPSNSVRLLVIASSTQVDITEQLSNTSVYNKIAIKYKQNDFALWVNGVEIATDTSGNTPSGLSQLDFDNAAGGDPFYGKTKQLMTFNEALSNEELSDLTGQINTSFVQLANFYNYTIL